MDVLDHIDMADEAAERGGSDPHVLAMLAIAAAVGGLADEVKELRKELRGESWDGASRAIASRRSESDRSDQ